MRSTRPKGDGHIQPENLHDHDPDHGEHAKRLRRHAHSVGHPAGHPARAVNADSGRQAKGHRWVVLGIMCAGMFLVLLDVTIVNVALPSLGDVLHSDLAGLQWVVDGYTVALAALLLAGGTLGDLHGHRRVVVVGLGVFGAASLACGLAPNLGLLVAARVLQGGGLRCCCRAHSP